MPLRLYRLLSHAARPLVPLLLARRLASGKEERARLGERRGYPGLSRPEAPLIWLHAASVGESLSILPLVEHLLARDPACHALVTTGTVTSAKILAARLPPRSAHQYVPVDTPDAVARFLDHWRPDAALWVESELWPNLLMETQRRGIAVGLVNARMSQRSFRRWARLPGLVRPLLAGFAATLAQSEADGARYTALGARDVRVVGDLKAVAAPLQADPDTLARLRQAIGRRPVWLAASTHPGEEGLAGRVHRVLAEHHRDLLTVIVPRHAARGDAIAAELAALALSVARRGKGAAPKADDAVFLGDTMGEMGLYLALAPAVFVGKSLLHEGGHNPREPALLGRAVLFGPHMENFATAAAALQQAGGAVEVADEAALAAQLRRLLDSPAIATEMGARARARAEAEAAGILDAALDALAPVLDRLGHARA